MQDWVGERWIPQGMTRGGSLGTGAYSDVSMECLDGSQAPNVIDLHLKISQD